MRSASAKLQALRASFRSLMKVSISSTGGAFGPGSPRSPSLPPVAPPRPPRDLAPPRLACRFGLASVLSHLSLFLSVLPSIQPSIHPSVHLSFRPPNPPIHPIRPSTQSVHPSSHPYAYRTRMIRLMLTRQAPKPRSPEALEAPKPWRPRAPGRALTLKQLRPGPPGAPPLHLRRRPSCHRRLRLLCSGSRRAGSRRD